MSLSETVMLFILGFATATFFALIIGRLAWKLAFRLGAKRNQKSIPSTVAELQSNRDRLRAEHAMMATKLEVRLEEMNMRGAEQAAMGADFFAGFIAPLFEGVWRPHLKLVAKADKSDRTVEARVAAKAFRKDDAAVPIDSENLDVAVERDRELVSLVRIIREA